MFYFQLGIQHADLKPGKGFKVTQSKNISNQVTEVTVPTPLNLFPVTSYTESWYEGSLNESFTRSISWDHSDFIMSVSCL